MTRHYWRQDKRHHRKRGRKWHHYSINGLPRAQEGINIGIEQGIEKGKAEATTELLRRTVQNMTDNGINIDQISRVTELSSEEVQQLYMDTVS